MLNWQKEIISLHNEINNTITKKLKYKTTQYASSEVLAINIVYISPYKSKIQTLILSLWSNDMHKVANLFNETTSILCKKCIKNTKYSSTFKITFKIDNANEKTLNDFMNNLQQSTLLDPAKGSRANFKEISAEINHFIQCNFLPSMYINKLALASDINKHHVSNIENYPSLNYPIPNINYNHEIPTTQRLNSSRPLLHDIRSSAAFFGNQPNIQSTNNFYQLHNTKINEIKYSLIILNNLFDFSQSFLSGNLLKTMSEVKNQKEGVDFLRKLYDFNSINNLNNDLDILSHYFFYIAYQLFVHQSIGYKPSFNQLIQHLNKRSNENHNSLVTINTQIKNKLLKILLCILNTSLTSEGENGIYFDETRQVNISQLLITYFYTLLANDKNSDLKINLSNFTSILWSTYCQLTNQAIGSYKDGIWDQLLENMPSENEIIYKFLPQKDPTGLISYFIKKYRENLPPNVQYLQNNYWHLNQGMDGPCGLAISNFF